jgi:GH15 family glucan-1,4-alpha-glucosidase
VDQTAEGPLLYRYTRDRRPKGAFLACTSWLIEALVHAGPAPEARTLFEQALGYAGHTGLLSEEVDPDSGALRGNIPQALSHLALIGAATALAREP